MPVKTLFITSFHPHISRNILSTDVLVRLRRESGLRIVIIVPEYKADYFRKTFGSETALVEGVVPHRASATPRGLFFKKLGVRFFSTDTARARNAYEYRCEGKYGYYFLGVASAFLGRSRMLRRALRALDQRFCPKNFFAPLFDKYHPDLIFSTDVQNENDVSLMQDARVRGLRTLGMIRSWDNPTQRTVRFFPDRLLVGSDTLKNEVIRHLFYPADRITVTGNPHYDRYLKGPSTTREAFFAKFGLDTSKKTILYAPVGDHLLRVNDVDEHVMNILADMREQVIVRFPPDEGVRVLDFKKPPWMAYDRPGVAFTNTLFSDREISPDDDQRLIDSLYHCDLAVTGPTSIPLDAALVGKPSIIVHFYPTPRNFCGSIFNYWFSHIKKLVATGGVRYATSKERLLADIRAYLGNPSLDREKRDFVKSLWFSHADGRASERVWNEILFELGVA